MLLVLPNILATDIREPGTLAGRAVGQLAQPMADFRQRMIAGAQGLNQAAPAEPEPPTLHQLRRIAEQPTR